MKPLPLEDKERKALPIFKWLSEYFPDAIVECVKLSVAGNRQHNPELAPEDITWARHKSTQQMDTAFRHMWDHKAGIIWDKDGCYHLAKAAWRILAELQLTIEKVEQTQQENAHVFDPAEDHDHRPACHPLELQAQIRSEIVHCPKCTWSGREGSLHMCPQDPYAA